MKRFILYRIEDESNMSGTGEIVEGVIFSDGMVAVKWLTKYSSLGIYNSIEDFLCIHGHGGKSVVEMIDTDEHGRVE